MSWRLIRHLSMAVLIQRCRGSFRKKAAVEIIMGDSKVHGVLTALLSVSVVSNLLMTILWVDRRHGRIENMISLQHRPALAPSLLNWTRSENCAAPTADPKRFRSARVESYLTENIGIVSAFNRELEDYIRWHRRVGQQGPGSCARILVLTFNVKTGLGDHIRGAIHALIMAMETRRYLVLNPALGLAFAKAFKPAWINWGVERGVEQYYDGNRSVLDCKYDLQEPQLIRASGFERKLGDVHLVQVCCAVLPQYEKIVGTAWARANCNDEFDVGPFNMYTVDKKIRNDAKRRRCAYTGYENVAINKLAHRALFQYADSEMRRVRSIQRRLQLETGNYASIHARVGGRLDNSKAGRFKRYLKQSELTQYKMATCVVKKAANMKHVFVASDDEEYKRGIIEQLERLNVTAIASPIIAQHTRQGNELNTIEDALVEAVLLGDASIMITTGSGLSNMAVFGGRAKMIDLEDC